MTLRPRADGFRTEHPSSKRDSSILLGSILACVAAARCLGAPLRVAPDEGPKAGAGAAGDGGGNAGLFSDANSSEIGDAGGVDESGNDGAAGCAAPNPKGCSYPDEFATCPGNPAECVNGEWQCPFGVPCRDYGSDSDAPNGGDAMTESGMTDSSSEVRDVNDSSACDAMTCGPGQYCVHAYPGADGGDVIIGCFNVPAACAGAVPTCSCIAEDFFQKGGAACLMGCRQDDGRHFVCQGA